MPEIELFQRFALALAIGFLLGLERSWSGGEEEEQSRPAGLRTFTLSSLLGAVSAATSGIVGGPFLAAALLVFGGVLGAFYWRARAADEDYGATSLVAILLAFALGAYAVLGEMRIAAASAIVATVLLVFKAPLHAWLHQITQQEIRSALILLGMTFILLPLLPHEPIDPWGVIDLREAWLLAILIAAVSFAGYLALRLFGPQRGMALAGPLGGLISSTATTVSLARMVRAEFAPGPIAAAAILASGTALLRAGALAFVLHPPLLSTLWSPLLSAAVLVSGFGAWLLWRSPEGPKEFPLHNPFELRTVLVFAALLAVIIAVARTLLEHFGDRSLIALGALTGLVNETGITLVAARISSAQDVEPGTAALAILAGAAAGLIGRAGIGWSIGGRRFGLLLAAAAVLGILGGVASRSVFGGIP